MIAPSILSADFARLGEQLNELELAGIKIIHIDVMDGNFVPNISIGLPIVEACRRIFPAKSAITLDVHLMIEKPERYLENFAQAGADIITVHAEATIHLYRTLQMIKNLGKKAGLALNPGTPLDFFEPVLDLIDLGLVMSVNPGFGGQKFLVNALKRIEKLREWRQQRGLSFQIEVDGGINEQTIRACKEAGADIFVAGNAIFHGADSIQGRVERLHQLCD